MQRPLRISASSVDQFIKIGQPVHSFTDEIFTEEMYIAEVKKGWQPNAAMMFGSAFGAVITEPEKYVVSDTKYRWVERGFDLSLDYPQVQEGISIMSQYRPYTFWEEKREIQFKDSTVVCKCDGLAPNFLIENKTTSRFNYDSYQESLQWRLYLAAFPDAEFVRYHVFVFAADNKVGYRKFVEHQTFDCYRYPELVSDCESIIEEMSHFIYLHNLESYFAPYGKR